MPFLTDSVFKASKTQEDVHLTIHCQPLVSIAVERDGEIDR